MHPLWVLAASIALVSGCSRRPDIERVCTLGLIPTFGAVPAEETQACADANELILDAMSPLDRQSMEHCFSCLARDKVLAPLCVASCSGTTCSYHAGAKCGECDGEVVDAFCELGGEPAVPEP